MLATSDLVPEQTYKNKPANCLIALDLANRMSFPPLLVMKHLYIVKGKPAWSGKFCISIINSCGLFSPLEFITTEKGCYAQATRLSTGKLCVGPEVTWDMVKAEGWLDKSGSKWKTIALSVLTFLEKPRSRCCPEFSACPLLTFRSAVGILLSETTVSAFTPCVGVIGGEEVPVPSTDERLVGLAFSPPFIFIILPSESTTSCK